MPRMNRFSPTFYSKVMQDEDLRTNQKEYMAQLTVEDIRQDERVIARAQYEDPEMKRLIYEDIRRDERNIMKIDLAGERAQIMAHFGEERARLIAVFASERANWLTEVRVERAALVHEFRAELHATSIESAEEKARLLAEINAGRLKDKLAWDSFKRKTYIAGCVFVLIIIALNVWRSHG
jgi:hypothetical protein